MPEIARSGMMLGREATRRVLRRPGFRCSTMMENGLLNGDPRVGATSDRARRRVVDERTAAELLGVSLVHLRRLRRAHLGPKHVKLGERRIGYKLCDVDDWLDSRTFSDVYGLLRRA